MKSQYENLAYDATSKISERDGAINELKKEKLSFSQMVEESNRAVHQLKLVSELEKFKRVREIRSDVI